MVQTAWPLPLPHDSTEPDTTRPDPTLSNTTEPDTTRPDLKWGGATHPTPPGRVRSSGVVVVCQGDGHRRGRVTRSATGSRKSGAVTHARSHRVGPAQAVHQWAGELVRPKGSPPPVITATLPAASPTGHRSMALRPTEYWVCCNDEGPAMRGPPGRPAQLGLSIVFSLLLLGALTGQAWTGMAGFNERALGCRKSPSGRI